MPDHVRAASTTRVGGVSEGPFAGLNLAEHVGDDPEHVATNRLLLRNALSLPEEPRWLSQVHGCAVLDIGTAVPRQRTADAAVAFEPGRVCVVLTADCLPLLLSDSAGTVAAAVHAGWRGLLSGVIESAVAGMRTDPADIHVWLGPAIGPEAFEVGSEVRERFCARWPESSRAFRPGRHGRWLADLYGLARQRLALLGVASVSGGQYCTASDPERFFSYRRDGQTGRMATLVWLVGRGARSGPSPDGARRGRPLP